MWYEKLWSGGIIWVCVMGAMYVSGPINYLDKGRWYARSSQMDYRFFILSKYLLLLIQLCLDPIFRQNLMKRDHRLTGNMYVVSGIDSISDHDSF
jgi:hypothetical protein